jgi:putative membrane protein
VAETEFLSDMVMDSMVEEELGRIALDRASRDEVRQLARELIETRLAVGRQAFDLATSKGVAVPQDLNEDYRSMLQRLSRVTAEDFDSMYIDLVLREHERTVSDLMNDIIGIADVEVRSFAESAFELVEENFRMARLVANSLPT